MSNRTAVLHDLREERKQAQVHLEKLDLAISAMESLNGADAAEKANQPGRSVSPESRRRMALAQQARWAKVRKEAKPRATKAKATASIAGKRTMSVAGRRRIAAAQRARWAKVKAGQKRAV